MKWTKDSPSSRVGESSVARLTSVGMMEMMGWCQRGWGWCCRWWSWRIVIYWWQRWWCCRLERQLPRLGWCGHKQLKFLPLRAQLNQALHCIVLKQILDKRVRELVYYDFFQHKSFCSKRLCRVQLLYNHIGNKASALQCGLSSIYMLFRNLVLMTESAI